MSFRALVIGQSSKAKPAPKKAKKVEKPKVEEPKKVEKTEEKKEE